MAYKAPQLIAANGAHTQGRSHNEVGEVLEARSILAEASALSTEARSLFNGLTLLLLGFLQFDQRLISLRLSQASVVPNPLTS